MNPTIMVVEDEPAIQDLIQINLEMGGYRVLLHGTGEEALKSIQHELPDLALLDWMLPGISGIELAKKLRGDSRQRCGRRQTKRSRVGGGRLHYQTVFVARA